MEDVGSIARPYAVAAFSQACKETKTAEWSDMLEAIAVIVRDPTMTGLLANPKVRRDQLQALVLEVAGDRLSATGQNLVKVLVQYGRLGLAPEIAELYEEERARAEGRGQVEVSSAYELSESERDVIQSAMSKRLGQEVDLSLKVDRKLIGGVLIRAGDLVIDASLRGRLQQIASGLS